MADNDDRPMMINPNLDLDELRRTGKIVWKRPKDMPFVFNENGEPVPVPPPDNDGGR